MRGFKYRYVSPRQLPNIPDNEPIGGDTYWFGSAEYSIPIFEQEHGVGVRVAFFYDIGSVGGAPYNANFSGYQRRLWYRPAPQPPYRSPPARLRHPHPP